MVAGKLNQVLGEQWTWERTPAETAARDSNDDSLDSILLDDDDVTFAAKQRYDAPDNHHMLKAMRYSVKKQGAEADVRAPRDMASLPGTETSHVTSANGAAERAVKSRGSSSHSVTQSNHYSSAVFSAIDSDR